MWGEYSWKIIDYSSLVYSRCGIRFLLIDCLDDYQMLFYEKTLKSCVKISK